LSVRQTAIESVKYVVYPAHWFWAAAWLIAATLAPA
jgi:hypothetical protein